MAAARIHIFLVKIEQWIWVVYTTFQIVWVEIKWVPSYPTKHLRKKEMKERMGEKGPF